MKIIESGCVGCPTELGCLGKGCPYREYVRYECDCCSAPAEFEIDGEDFCPDCAEEILTDAFEDLTIWERAELLGIKCKEL